MSAVVIDVIVDVEADSDEIFVLKGVYKISLELKSDKNKLTELFEESLRIISILPSLLKSPLENDDIDAVAGRLNN